MAKTKASDGEKTLLQNRRARFDYALEKRFEAGMVLLGSEVKSLRASKGDLSDAWASVERDGVYLKNMTIQPLPHHTSFVHEPRRPRKLLLHAHEIDELRKAIERGGMTIVPLRVYLKNGYVKIEIALAKGKTKGDKRESIRSREAEREARSAMARGRKG